jgi:hypothetical protein
MMMSNVFVSTLKAYRLPRTGDMGCKSQEAWSLATVGFNRHKARKVNIP